MNQTEFLSKRLFKYDGRIQVLMELGEAVSLLEKAGTVPTVVNNTKPGAHKAKLKPGPKKGWKQGSPEGEAKKND